MNTIYSGLLFLVAAFGLIQSINLGVQAQSPLYLRTTSNAPDWRLAWQKTLVDSNGVERLPRYELQRSDDLKSWSRVGEPFVVGSGALTDSFLADLVKTSPKGFYRLRAAWGEYSAAAQLGVGGEEVFGYGPLFEEELSRIGQISPDDFAALFPSPAPAVEQIDFDPTSYKYWDEFNADPQVVNQGKLNPSPAYRFSDFRLNSNELALFRKNGFVVSERLGAHTFAQAFYRIWHDDLPVFVSTDAILQAWHRTYDAMLQEFEYLWLWDNLDHMLEEMAANIPAASTEATGGILSDSVLDADYFLSVARSLLAGQHVPGSLGQSLRVMSTLDAIIKEQLDSCFELFGSKRFVDFSQFAVRGHYAESVRLSRYFKCVMWLGRTDFRVGGGPFQDSECTPPHKADIRELGTAVVLNNLLNRSGQFERWRKFDEIIQLFAGTTDSLTFAQLDDVLNSAGVKSLEDIQTVAKLSDLQAAIEAGNFGAQYIRSDSFVSPFGPERIVLPRSFSVFGQRFSPDSWAMSKVVFDDILWRNNGVTNKVCRRLPTSLDVAFSVLANNHVVADIQNQFQDGQYYQHNLAAVRAVLDLQSEAAWSGNLYSSWLGVVRELSLPLASQTNFPQAFLSRAWTMKSLNTQLASWTQLRHDTILYVKQSYTSDAICSYPAVLVEPHPTFWSRLAQMAESAATKVAGLNATGTVTVAVAVGEVPFPMAEVISRAAAHLRNFGETVRVLDRVSNASVTGQKVDAGDSKFLCQLIQQVWPDQLYCGREPAYDGWYPKLFFKSVGWDFEWQRKLLNLGPDTNFTTLYLTTRFHQEAGSDRWDNLVADVHTDGPSDGVCPSPGSVLHEATGDINLMMIAAQVGGTNMVFAGPVLSHFEFKVPGPPHRFSDQEWNQLITSAERPNLLIEPSWIRRVSVPYYSDKRAMRFAPRPPPWTSSYLVPNYP